MWTFSFWVSYSLVNYFSGIWWPAQRESRSELGVWISLRLCFFLFLHGSIRKKATFSVYHRRQYIRTVLARTGRGGYDDYIWAIELTGMTFATFFGFSTTAQGCVSQGNEVDSDIDNDFFLICPLEDVLVSFLVECSRRIQAFTVSSLSDESNCDASFEMVAI